MLNFIICDTTSGAGIYGGYDGSTFWAFNEQKTNYSLPELNLHINLGGFYMSLKNLLNK